MHHKEQGQKPRNIRTQNRRIILDLYHRNEGLSVTEVSDQAGLSRTTVMKVVQQLLEDGLLVESGKRFINESGGKRPVIYSFNSRIKLIITAYIQYEKILLRVFDLRFNVLLDDTAEITRNMDLTDIAGKIGGMIERGVKTNEAFSESDFLACMIGLHGNIDLSSGICLQATHFHSWGLNRNVRDIFENELALNCPVYIDNWIRFKTFGKSRTGSAEKKGAFLLLDAGWHGVGLGVLQNGELYQGKNNVAGEIGHFRVNYEDKEECFCGSRGCFEQQVMLERLHERAEADADKYLSSPLSDTAGSFTYEDLFNAADSGDAFACSLLDPLIGWFAAVVSYLILFMDPDVLSIEGEYASGCRYFENGLISALKETALPRIARGEVVRFRKSGTDSVLLGAAISAYEMYFPAFSESGM